MVTLSNVCQEGLLVSLRNRINVRRSTESLKWRLQKYVGFTRIVSTNIVRLDVEKSALYQVVVKIKSMQNLERTAENGFASDAMEKRVVEYVVLQKLVWRGKEEKWKIWGTIEESRVEDVLGDNKLVTAQPVGTQ